MDKEKELLTRCLEQIGQVLGWGPSGEWSNSDFESLSEKIAAKTQVRLSVSTLKRIWGRVRYDSSPTPATLNVLARFLGYDGWRDFQIHTMPVAPEVEAPAAVAEPVSVTPAVRKRAWWRLYTPLFAGMVAAAVFLIVKGKTPARHTGDVVFEVHKVSDDLPNSVVFTYSIGGFAADSVFIQQSWDPARRQRVPATGGQHTSIYYTPGYFLAKLIANDSVLKEDIVFIKTKGWKGIIDGKPPVYLSDAEMHQPGGLGVDRGVLRDKTGSPVFTDRWVTFSNVRVFDSLRSDDFVLDVSLRNTATVEECLCRRVKVTILMRGGAIIIPLAARGCISDIGLLTSERWLAGETNDLSAFGFDFTSFERIRCEAAGGHFRIFVNEVLVLDELQQRPPVDIVGLRVAFEGTGEIQYVKLSGKGYAGLADRFSPHLQ